MSAPAKKHSSRRKTAARQKEDQRLEKQERDKLICHRFAQLRNASRVAREYGVSRMYVTRIWERQSEEERDALLSVREQVDEELNRKIAKAEAIAGDKFTANVVQARELLGEELIRRCTSVDIREISDKDFTSLLRLVATIVAPDNDPDKPRNTEDSIFNTLRQTIQVSINQNDE